MGHSDRVMHSFILCFFRSAWLTRLCFLQIFLKQRVSRQNYPRMQRHAPSFLIITRDTRQVFLTISKFGSFFLGKNQNITQELVPFCNNHALELASV